MINQKQVIFNKTNLSKMRVLLLTLTLLSLACTEDNPRAAYLSHRHHLETRTAGLDT